MAFKLAMLCLLLAVGSSMVSARTLTEATPSYAVDSDSCYIYNTCGWQAPGCQPNPAKITASVSVDLIVKACVTAILIGKINAVIAVVALIKLLIVLNLNLCASVIIALIAHVNIGVVVVAKAFLQVCALVDGVLIAKLVVLLKVDVLIKLCLALGIDACLQLFLVLFALIRLNVTGYVQVLAGCCNGLYVLGTVWVQVIAKVFIQLGVYVCGPLIKILSTDCLSVILKVCLSLPGGSSFVCACKTVLGLSLNLLGIPITLCILG